jgi:hypothetical protein
MAVESGTYDQATVARHQAIAEAMLKESRNAKPIRHWAEGLAQLADAGVAGYASYKADSESKALRSQDTAALASLLGGSPASPTASPVSPAPSPVPTTPPGGAPMAAAPMGNAVASAMSPGAGAAPVNVPRPEVMPSPKVWGDKEAEDAGLYEKPAAAQPGVKVAAALGGNAPMPAPAPAGPAPAAAPPPGGLLASATPQQKATIAAGLQASPDSPANKIAMAMITKLAANETPKYDFKTAGDSLYRTNAATGTAEPIKEIGRGVKPMTDEQRQQWKVPEGVAAGIDDNGKPVFSQPSAVNTVSPVVAGINERFDAAAKSAAAAPQVISSIHEARRALDSGAFTGAAADQRLFLAKIGTAMGLPSEAVANTEVARAALGAQVLESAKTLGANPSNADRDYIEKVKGGSIKLDEGSMRRLLDMQEKWGRDSVRRANDMGGKMVQTDPEKLGRFKSLMTFEDPPAYADYIKSNPGKAAASTDAGWQDMGGGVRIREKK